MTCFLRRPTVDVKSNKGERKRNVLADIFLQNDVMNRKAYLSIIDESNGKLLRQWAKRLENAADNGQIFVQIDFR